VVPCASPLQGDSQFLAFGFAGASWQDRIVLGGVEELQEQSDDGGLVGGEADGVLGSFLILCQSP
jgi:hypothetical protein